jgi:hypothetical protein
MLEMFKQRCIQDRREKLTLMEEICNASSSDCFRRFKDMLSSLDSCYREWQDKNTTITHPMSDLTNALVYAFRLFTIDFFINTNHYNNLVFILQLGMARLALRLFRLVS